MILALARLPSEAQVFNRWHAVCSAAASERYWMSTAR